jgi:dTDP-4-amino-4,6-dideoxygalactose transaminase
MINLALTGAAPCIPADSHNKWPDITDDDHRALAALLESGELAGTTVPAITGLEADWAAYCGGGQARVSGSGTAAIHLALIGAGVGPGDEVITPAYSFAATPMAILHAGAIPVFADIDPDTYNIDPDHASALVSSRTTALLPVHIHGLPADMDRLNAVARARGLAVVEDAAQAHGASYHGRKAGTLGDAAAFSLNVSKALPGGEGGLYVTASDSALKVVSRARVFGEDTPDLGPNETRAFWSRGTGYQYRPPAQAAALARSQLVRLDSYLTRARSNAGILTAGLTGIPGIVPPFVPPGLESSWWKYMIRLVPEQLGWDGSPVELRDRVIFALRQEGVMAGTWQRRPLPALPAFRRAEPGPWRPGAPESLPWHPDDYPVTSAFLRTAVVLGNERHPLYVQTPELMKRYVGAVRRVIDGISAVRTAPYEPLTEVPRVGDGW